MVRTAICAVFIRVTVFSHAVKPSAPRRPLIPSRHRELSGKGIWALAWRNAGSGDRRHGERMVIQPERDRVKCRAEQVFPRELLAKARVRYACARSGINVVNERCRYARLLRGLQCGKTAVEIGLEIVDVLEPDMQAQRRAARRPCRRRAIGFAIERD